LIGDAKLGGISATISAYESLLLRGFIVDSVLIFRDDYYRNWEYLAPYFSERGIQVVAISPPPPLSNHTIKDPVSTMEYYDKISSEGSDTTVHGVLSQLDECHARRLQELESMPRRALDNIWWPFVQHGLVKGEQDVNVIDSAQRDFFSVYKPSSQNVLPASHNRSILEHQFDGSASWWTQALGHAHPSLVMAAARAAGRYGHVMFPQAVHLPALKLAERLLRYGPGKGWASRAFFSDNGSTGMEIALKMGLRYFSIREGGNLIPSASKELGVIGLKGSYHGDTIGAMDACEEGVYTCEWHNAKGYWFEPPRVYMQNGEVILSLPAAIVGSSSSITNIKASSLPWVYNMTERLKTALAEVYQEYIERTLTNLTKTNSRTLAALVLEPLVMGAGGMIFVDPLFQRVMVDVVRGTNGNLPSPWSGLPIIFDEVFVGLYRIGMESSSSVLGVYPDISVNAKILTGGLVPMAVTMTSDAVFQAFKSENKIDALLHGHSYTAHPIGCEIANETLKIVDKLTSSDLWDDARKKWAKPGLDAESSAIWSFWDPTFLDAISRLDVISEVMALGTVLTFKINDERGGKLFP
jgi:bifunctional dethiobiotin synthetase / adenosylmethionine---8-amino-7-oxononanoate aminotransferase